MEKKIITGGFSKLAKYLQKMKYPLLILLLGAFLMLLPNKGAEKSKQPAEDVPETQTAEADCEARLEAILSKIQGAGQVSVMLTVKSGEQVLYQQDTNLDSDVDGTQESQRRQNTTVLISNGSGTESAVISQVNGPKYQGAVVVCSGGDNPSVKLSVVQAVCSVTGLGADQVTVLKMQ